MKTSFRTVLSLLSPVALPLWMESLYVRSLDIAHESILQIMFRTIRFRFIWRAMTYLQKLSLFRSALIRDMSLSRTIIIKNAWRKNENMKKSLSITTAVFRRLFQIHYNYSEDFGGRNSKNCMKIWLTTECCMTSRDIKLDFSSKNYEKTAVWFLCLLPQLQKNFLIPLFDQYF